MISVPIDVVQKAKELAYTYGEFELVEVLRKAIERPDNPMKLNKRGGRRRVAMPTNPSLTPDQVREARELRLTGKPIKELMAKYKVSRSTLRNALYGLGYYEGIL